MAQVQLHHRLLAVSTIAAYTAIYVKARKPNVWANLPEESKLAMNATMAAVGGQVRSNYHRYRCLNCRDSQLVFVSVSARIWRDDARELSADDAGAGAPEWRCAHPRVVDLGVAHAPLRSSWRHRRCRQDHDEDSLRPLVDPGSETCALWFG